MEFNINNNVQVRLTDHGRYLHATDHAALCASIRRDIPYTSPKEDPDGWSTWQLHSLMSEFGPHISLGGKLCFETTIRLISPPVGNAPAAPDLDCQQTADEIERLHAQVANLEAGIRELVAASGSPIVGA